MQQGATSWSDCDMWWKVDFIQLVTTSSVVGPRRSSKTLLKAKWKVVKVLIARLHYPWNSPGKNTGVGSHFFLQGIFSTQGLNPGLLHFRKILCHLSHEGSPFQSQTCTKKGHGHCLVVCCQSDPLQLSESQQNNYTWEVCSANWWDTAKTAVSSAGIA